MPFSSILQQLWRWVQASPRAPALMVGQEVALTYAELAQRSLEVAGWLTAQGVGRGDLVAIEAPRGPDYLTGLLGAWCCGAAWVYLDPSWPPVRKRVVLEQGHVKVVLHGHERGAPRPAPARLAAQDLAYAFWTSGSTGAPKGVLVQHGGLPSMVAQQVEAFGLGPHKRALLVLKCSFDASVSDLMTALSSGAALVVDPELEAGPLTSQGLLRALERGQVTHVDLPPSLLPTMSSALVPACLETVVIGGEVPDVNAARSWAQRVRLISVYGPTEATVCTSMVHCTASVAAGDLGAPMTGVRYLVCDASGRAVPEGVPGELWIGGAQVARGYVGQDVLTRQRFVQRDGLRWFRTGDRVVRGAGQRHSFLGRLDRQFKRHGQLVAPEEVEAVLLLHPGVLRARVGMLKESLVAVVQTREELPIETQDVLRFVRARLPGYLVPSRLEVHAPWPQSDSGKVDEARLWTEAFDGGAPASMDAQGGVLVQLASRVLGRPAQPELGLPSQGADSLALIRFVALCEQVGLDVAAADVAADLPITKLGVRGAPVSSATAADLQTELRSYAPQPCRPWVSGRGQAWLLTGATGYLGAQVLLAHSARDPDATWWVLARGEDAGHARRRVRAACEALRPGHFDALGARIEVLAGDLTRPNFGLREGEYAELGRRIDAVHHMAAQVHSLAPARSLWADNVEATEALLGFALQAQVQRFVYASTLSVFVGTDQDAGRALESDHLEGTEEIYGGYAQSKWAAERALWRATQAGLPTLCLRYGLITPARAGGAFAERDQLRHLILGLRELGAVPHEVLDPRLFIDVTPVDWAAEVAVRLAMQPEAAGAYHLSGARVAWRDWVQAMRAHGVPLKEVCGEAFAGLAGRRGSSACIALLSLVRGRGADQRRRGMDLLQATGVEFDCSRTAAAMAQEGLPWPDVDSGLVQDYVRRVMESAA